MGIFDDFAKSKQMEKEREAKRKEEERLKKEKEAKRVADTKEDINTVLIERELGKPLYHIMGLDSELFVYPNMIIISRLNMKMVNAFNHTAKVIPFRNIKTIQFKNSGVMPGCIDFGVSGFDATTKDAVNFENENRFNLLRENVKQSIEAFFYIVKHIG